MHDNFKSMLSHSHAFPNSQLIERKVGKVVGVENWGQPEKLQLDVQEQIRKTETDKKQKGERRVGGESK